MERERKILIIVENLPVPFDARVWQEATTLVANGYTVSVICPVGKRYTRTHLGCLIVITILKSVLPIGSIGRIIAWELDSGKPHGELYDRFCLAYETTGQAALAAAARVLAAYPGRFILRHDTFSHMRDAAAAAGIEAAVLRG